MRMRKALPEDFHKFYPHIDDIAEAENAGVNWRENLREALEHENTVVLEYRGEIISVGGNTGDQCWFITSYLVDSLSKAERLIFRSAIVEHRDMLHEIYPVLWNFVWEFNKGHKRFLESIGAVFHEEYIMSPKGSRFQLFTIRR